MSEKTILYVDDEKDIRLVVGATLKNAGYKVLLAGSAEEGLRIAFAEFPDLVITDVMMPDESGYSLCKKLKSKPATAKIPVVFLTVMDDEQTAIDAGGSGFLSKPFEEQQLLSTVESLLKPSDGRAELERAMESIKQGDYPRALASLERVANGGTDVAAWGHYHAGQIHQMQGNTAQASDSYKKALGIDAAFYRAHGRLGQIFETAGDIDRAVKHYEMSLSILPTQADVAERVRKLKES